MSDHLLSGLRHSEALDHLDAEALARLAACGEAWNLSDGDVVFDENEPSDEVYIVLAGGVSLERRTRYGPVELAQLESGDLFGEVAFLDQEGRSGRGTARGDTQLARLDSDDLHRACKEDQGFHLALHWALWRSLAAKLRETNERLAAFFGTRTEPAPEGGSTADGRADASVDLKAKQALFREQKLSSMEIGFLSSLSQEERFEEGETIFLDGDEARKLYVVLEGAVMISKNIVGAGEEALAFLSRGDYFGEMALFDQRPRSAHAKAHTGGATVLSLDREVVSGVLDAERVSSVRLLRILCSLAAERLRAADEKLIGWHLLDRAGSD